jgi:hypothetical protein
MAAEVAANVFAASGGILRIGSVVLDAVNTFGEGRRLDEIGR